MDLLHRIWTTQKAWLSSVFSLFASLGLQGTLQIVILLFGVIAGYFAFKRNRDEAKIAEIKLKKLSGANK
ncbi:hypothetical protein [Vibrio parahaemolyticus]|uniref:hypothetical protein n=1 Tax=Vibrio parahaemolyticus TaxID=670 RepID=UPI000B51BBCF|nr:hypothetical protein [Vibrio parahaemolyticus]EGQ8036388.1 hypothetical protein [Vibrio parahaemolyticus]EGQ8513569.1 hypothetical protein [Vibrio parahaemolyticus]EGR2972964.1 hypothetical protein [Vibrio parahaemolyticus]EGR3062766.1 hypothetical protein [Vibrio parahaemolyticus]EGR3072560.1 hypothetical protein [Vibrio parahaemolyticus]